VATVTARGVFLAASVNVAFCSWLVVVIVKRSHAAVVDGYAAYME